MNNGVEGLLLDGMLIIAAGIIFWAIWPDFKVFLEATKN